MRTGFAAEDYGTWLPLVQHVIRVAFPGGFPSYVDRDDLEQECLIKLPAIIGEYKGKDGAKLETFVRGAVRNDVRDHLKRLHRQNERERAVALPKDEILWDANGYRVHRDSKVWNIAQRVGGYANASMWLETDPDRSVKDDELDAVKHALTKDQFAVYMCRFVLRMTQQTTADYLRTTRNAIASRERKITANLRKDGLPVPKRVAQVSEGENQCEPQ